MKFLIFISLLATISLGIFSCNKSQENDVAKTVDLTLKTDNAKIAIVSEDIDWKYIAIQNQETISKFVNSNINLANFDFDNETEFLKVIGTSKAEYLDRVAKTKAAAGRLI